MKLSKGEKAVLGVTAALLLAMGGHHLLSQRTVTVESVPPPVAAPETDASARLDVNTAGLEELMSLPGIGETRAQAILDYRAEHGPFAYAEELIRVPGIGERTLREFIHLVTAGGTEYAENSGG